MVRLVGRGYRSVIRQDTVGKHGLRAAPVARSANFHPRTGPPQQPHIGIVIENLHLVSGVDWTQQGKPTAGVAIYLSSSRLVFLNHIWIDGYDPGLGDTSHYRTRRWAGGIWFDDVDPGNLPCRHTSVVGFFIQSIGDDSQYAGDADPNIAARRVGHCGILLRICNHGQDGASGWGHNFVNGIVQTEHATDSMEYYVNGNAPGYCGYRNAASDGTHFMNVEFIDFYRCGWFEVDFDFSPWGLSNTRYESCSFEVPGVGQPAAYFRGAISQHEFWGCNFYGSGLAAESAQSYGVDIDCIGAAGIRFIDCLFSTHQAAGYQDLKGAVYIANTYGEDWLASPRFTNCEFTPHDPPNNQPSGDGLVLASSNVSGVAAIGCTFRLLNRGIRLSTTLTQNNLRRNLVIGNTFAICNTGIQVVSVSAGTLTNNVIAQNVFESVTTPVSLSQAFQNELSNLIMLNSSERANVPRLTSVLSGPNSGLRNSNLAILAKGTTDTTFFGPRHYVARTILNANQTGTFLVWSFLPTNDYSGVATALYVDARVVVKSANHAAFHCRWAFLWDGTNLSAIGTQVRNLWRGVTSIDANLGVAAGPPPAITLNVTVNDSTTVAKTIVAYVTVLPAPTV